MYSIGYCRSTLGHPTHAHFAAVLFLIVKRTLYKVIDTTTNSYYSCQRSLYLYGAVSIQLVGERDTKLLHFNLFDQVEHSTVWAGKYHRGSWDWGSVVDDWPASSQHWLFLLLAGWSSSNKENIMTWVTSPPNNVGPASKIVAQHLIA